MTLSSDSNMQAVILTAGRGVRMGSLTSDLPKPMLRLKGRPILEYTLASLPAEISEVIFIIGYKGEMVKAYFGDSFGGRKISYVVQNELNGTAGALRSAEDFLEGEFLVLNGDDLYLQSDLENLIKENPPAVLAKKFDNPEKFGVVRTDDNGNLLEVIESGNERDKRLNLVNIGAYFLNKDFFSYEPAKKSAKVSEKEFGLPQTLTQMSGDRKIKVIEADFWQPVSSPEDIPDAEKCV